MRVKHLARELGVTDGAVMKAATEEGLSISFRNELSEEQIASLKSRLASTFSPQLNAADSLENAESAPDNIATEESEKNAIEQSPESVLDVVTAKQSAFSNAIAANESQQAHILETKIQQTAADAFRLGVVTELLSATKELEGAMLVRDAVFHKSQASRDRLNELLKDTVGDDFLGNSQVAAKTYTNTAKTGPSTSLDTYKALKNLGIKF